jgi:hypothetical protein
MNVEQREIKRKKMNSTSSPYTACIFSCITVYKMPHDVSQLEPKRVAINKPI